MIGTYDPDTGINSPTGQELHVALQRLITAELERVDDRFHEADSNENAVDVKAIEALLAADALNKVLTELNNQVAAAKQVIGDQLVEQFALLGVQSMNVAGSTIYKNVERYANAKPEHRQEIVQWARDNGLDDMIVVQPQRFKAWCRETLEQGALPEAIADMVEVFEKASLRIRKA